MGKKVMSAVIRKYAQYPINHKQTEACRMEIFHFCPLAAVHILKFCQWMGEPNKLQPEQLVL